MAAKGPTQVCIDFQKHSSGMRPPRPDTYKKRCLGQITSNQGTKGGILNTAQRNRGAGYERDKRSRDENLALVACFGAWRSEVTLIHGCLEREVADSRRADPKCKPERQKPFLSFGFLFDRRNGSATGRGRGVRNIPAFLLLVPFLVANLLLPNSSRGNHGLWIMML